MENTLLILGVNHRSAPVAVRERLAFAQQEVAPALRRLKQKIPRLAEAALISTCNRVEVIGVTSEPVVAGDEIANFLAADREVAPSAFTEALYRFDGRDAVRHLFRVGASLDSMVVGEPQILGQLKLSYAQAAEAGSVGLVLHRAFHKAFQVAKRVRKTTLIGHGSVSVSSVAVSLAGQIFDTLGDKTAMLMGAGKMAELTARHLKALGIESLLITSRTFDRAVELARDLGGTAVPFENYKPYLRIADILIGSLSVTKPMFGKGEMEAVIRERKYRPIFMIDLGVPRNFHEHLNEIENIYLYDIDDLDAVAQKSLGGREREAEKAEQIVDEEIDGFLKWLGELDIVPTIKDIRVSMERLRDLELTRHRAWLGTLEPAERERIEMLTRGLVNKLLHRIMSGLRQHEGSSPDAIHVAEVARQLLCENGDANLDAKEIEDELRAQLLEDPGDDGDPL
ncbi:MAG TPA: glutamyl-tRNA reductase [Candidatus Binataceae bacterium]|nr:glutamyl-tRNA reductase [Candidatus Binataceae bacterium]